MMGKLIILLILFNLYIKFVPGNQNVNLKLKLMESKYLKSEEFLLAKLTLDFISDTVIWIKQDLQIFMVNEAACKSLGYLREELLKMKIVDIDMNYPHSNWMKDWEFISDGGELAIESRFTRKSGESFPVDIRANVAVFEEEQFVCTVIRDITEKQKVLAALKELEEKFYKAFVNNPAPIHITSVPDGIFVDVNPMFEKISGFSKNELIGKKATELGLYVDESDRDRLFEELQAKGRLQDFEMSFQVRSGEIRLCRLFAEIIELHGQKHLLTITNDITDRNRLESALRQSEERNRIIIDNIPTGVWITNRGGKTFFISDNAEKIYGYSPDEIYSGIAKPWYERIHQDDREMASKAFDKLFETGEKYDVEFRAKRKDGKWIWVQDTAITVKEMNGERFAYGVFSDITDRKIAEEKLRKEREFSESILNTVVDTIIVFDPKSGKPIRWNAAFREKSGFSDEEIVKIKAPDVWYNQEDLNKVRIEIDKLQKGEKSIVELSLRNKDGELLPTEYTASITYDSEGSPEYVTAVGRDISERKLAEKAIKESEERYRLLIENIPSVVWSTNSEGKTSFIGSNVKQIYGYSPEDIYNGKEGLWLERIHPEDREKVTKAYQALFSKVEKFDIEYRIKRKDGVWIWLHDTADHIKDIGEERYAYGVFSEITQKKKTEKALLESEEKYKNLAEYSNVGRIKSGSLTSNETPAVNVAV